MEKCRKIRTRGREDDITIDLHVVVDQKMAAQDAHALAHELEQRLRLQIPGITDVQIHREPSSA
ncbi:MAG: hypothetical protein JSV16_14770 [Candidatus Hydrogenedentota bacterium]|nr:MAG: hypothetical protein JSV16_14770 [Candidatus Hydrogenedentota bacterium]